MRSIAAPLDAPAGAALRDPSLEQWTRALWRMEHGTDFWRVDDMSPRMVWLSVHRYARCARWQRATGQLAGVGLGDYPRHARLLAAVTRPDAPGYVARPRAVHGSAIRGPRWYERRLLAAAKQDDPGGVP